jgi:fluoride exporter
VKEVLFVALGGALGALSRYGITLGVGRAMGTGWPWGTLLANVLGCLIAGFFIQMTLTTELVSKEIKVGIAIGFLGALTTFSTFSHDTFRLALAGSWGPAAANIGANLVVGLVAVVVGFLAARAAFG